MKGRCPPIETRSVLREERKSFRAKHSEHPDNGSVQPVILPEDEKSIERAIAGAAGTVFASFPLGTRQSHSHFRPAQTIEPIEFWLQDPDFHPTDAAWEDVNRPKTRSLLRTAIVRHSTIWTAYPAAARACEASPVPSCGWRFRGRREETRPTVRRVKSCLPTCGFRSHSIGQLSPRHFDVDALFRNSALRNRLSSVVWIPLKTTFDRDAVTDH